MPIAQSRAQPIAPVSFCMIFDKIFIIPPKKNCESAHPARGQTCVVDERDEGGGGAILMSSSPE
jgi:hypothetical protein